MLRDTFVFSSSTHSTYENGCVALCRRHTPSLYYHEHHLLSSSTYTCFLHYFKLSYISYAWTIITRGTSLSHSLCLFLFSLFSLYVRVYIATQTIYYWLKLCVICFICSGWFKLLLFLLLLPLSNQIGILLNYNLIFAAMSVFAKNFKFLIWHDNQIYHVNPFIFLYGRRSFFDSQWEFFSLSYNEQSIIVVVL